MAERVSVAGLRELDAALGELPKATGKAVLRRTLKTAGQPIADAAESRAPRAPGSGQLARSIDIGTKLSRRQARLHRKMFRDDKASAEVFVGAGALPQAHLREFGSDGAPAAPFMRPAWDGNRHQALETIKAELWGEIEKSAKRLARKQARLAKGR